MSEEGRGKKEDGNGAKREVGSLHRCTTASLNRKRRKDKNGWRGRVGVNLQRGMNDITFTDYPLLPHTLSLSPLSPPPSSLPPSSSLSSSYWGVSSPFLWMNLIGRFQLDFSWGAWHNSHFANLSYLTSDATLQSKLSVIINNPLICTSSAKIQCKPSS